MFETEKPGSGRDRRAFHIARDDSGRHDCVDENDLRQREGFLHGVDGDFLTNVVGPVAQDGRPSDAEFGGRIFEFDADLPPR